MKPFCWISQFSFRSVCVTTWELIFISPPCSSYMSQICLCHCLAFQSHVFERLLQQHLPKNIVVKLAAYFTLRLLHFYSMYSLFCIQLFWVHDTKHRGLVRIESLPLESQGLGISLHVSYLSYCDLVRILVDTMFQLALTVPDQI